MRKRKITHLLGILAWLILLAGCRSGGGEFTETFDTPGNWRTGSDAEVEGEVQDGIYSLLVKADNLLIWTTAGESFSDGIYEVEATQIEGPINNGYGMLLRVDDDRDDFYVFEISGDGFVWIGRYRNGGEEEIEPLVSDWWFESSAVKQGLNAMNKLRVRAEGPNMIFFVNDQEVGRVSDDAFSSGDIGLMVETLGAGGVRVQFDNFTVTPIER